MKNCTLRRILSVTLTATMLLLSMAACHPTPPVGAETDPTTDAPTETPTEAPTETEAVTDAYENALFYQALNSMVGIYHMLGGE